jgi:hypothetical protein
MPRCIFAALIVGMSAPIGAASAAQGLTDEQMDRVTAGTIATAADMSEFFSARAEAEGLIAEASAHADDVSARASGSAQTIAPDSGNVRSRAETVGVAPPPPQQESGPVRLQRGDLWDHRMGDAAGKKSLPFSWLR